ncbi:MAG: hypothetical protein CUN56_07120 [Phototrophicales bacterium]|nr:MAG: hypothetical protein CUN56_07120 [Phototrophicales bacterium]
MIKADVQKILAAKRKSLAIRQQKTPIAAINALAQMQQPPRPLLSQVSTPDDLIILGQVTLKEIYDPIAAALRYIRSGIDGIAFFTDHTIYSKSLDDLLLLSRAAHQHGVLYQNYILDSYNVAEVRAAGASSMIVYASILSRSALRNIVSTAQRWRMSVIIQVNTVDEIQYAMQLAPHVISIGMDYLFDAERDLKRIEILRDYVPYNVRMMATGCVGTLKDAQILTELGVDAIIVDERLARTPQQIEELRQLKG